MHGAALAASFWDLFRTSGNIIEKPWNKPKTALPVDKSYPTPWNNLEAGILYSLNLPLMILREPAISGGVFDRGVTDVFVHTIPDKNFQASQLDELYEAMLKWHSQVQKHYYEL